jgi:sarcosine oxidase
MSARSFDVIVVGVGGMGSAAVHHLASRGRRVLGLEQFDVPHERGSSHGVNRIFRLAYYEHASYVPLMRRALELWRLLERSAGETLVHVTGSVDAGLADSAVFAGSLESCRLHGLEHEVLDGRELGRRFPGYRLAAEMRALYQPDGGFVLAERGIVAHVYAALGAGAEVRARETVRSWEGVGGGGVRVATDRGTYEAGALVVTAGAWAGRLLPGLAGRAVPERQVLGWFQPLRPDRFGVERFPVFNLQAEEGRYYGFPLHGVPGFKIGRYHHRDEVVDPEAPIREPTYDDEAVLRAAVTRYFPDADGPTMALKTCMFTNSPDEHFIVGAVSNEPLVCVAAGFSGHGYKFASVIGEVLADLVVSGHTANDVSRFAPDRFG